MSKREYSKKYHWHMNKSVKQMLFGTYKVIEEPDAPAMYGLDIEDIVDTAIRSKFYVDTQIEQMHIANGMPYSERRK